MNGIIQNLMILGLKLTQHYICLILWSKQVQGVGKETLPFVQKATNLHAKGVWTQGEQNWSCLFK